MTGPTPRRVLHVSQPTTEGTAVVVRQLVRAGIARGDDVRVACPAEGDLASWVRAEGATWVDLPMVRSPRLAELMLLPRVRRLMRCSDLVIAHSSKAGALVRLAATVPGRDRAPLVFMPHGWSWLVGVRLAPAYRRFERWASRRTAVVVCVSDEEAAEGRRVLGEGAGLVVIHNGVDVEQLRSSTAAASRDAAPLLVLVGRLGTQKGQDLAVRVLAQMTEGTTRLRLVGDGPDESSLLRLAGELGVEDRLELVGRADALPHLRAADVVLVPSRWEGLSVALLEAMALEKAIVATDAGGGTALGSAGRVVESSYFTGIIRDKQGRKMSKTLGNSPDPLELIAKYGADALRFGTMRSAPLGQDVLFDEKDVELGRNFCNKLWNACRFRQMQGGEVQGEINPQLLTNDDKWILLKLNEAIKEITVALAEYNFSTAAQTLYRFFWGEYCDWYVEASKAVLQGNDEKKKANTVAVIDFVLSHTLRLFHPFLPFITEELWHGMGYATDMPNDQGGKTIMFAPWPKPFDQDMRDHYGLDDCYLDFAQQKFDLVTQGRNLRREGNIAANKKVKFILKPENDLPPHDIQVLKLLLNAESFELDPNYQPKKGTLTIKAVLGELFLPLEGLVDVEAEKARLTKELEKIEAEISKVEQKLANPNFTQKVPPQVLAEHQKRLEDWKAKREHALAALKALEG